MIIFFGFWVNYRLEKKSVKTGNLSPINCSSDTTWCVLGFPIFRWEWITMILGGFDPHDPTTNRTGRTVHDWYPRQSLNQLHDVINRANGTINLSTKDFSCRQIKNKQENNSVSNLKLRICYMDINLKDKVWGPGRMSDGRTSRYERRQIKVAMLNFL